MSSRPHSSRGRLRGVRPTLAALAIGILALLFAWTRPDEALRVATASSASKLCADVFIEGIEAQRAYDEDVVPMPGMGLLLRGLSHRVDADTRSATVAWHGRFESVATFHPGYGCALALHTPDAATLAAARALAEDTATPTPIVETADPAMGAALDHAFAEPASGPRRNVHAIVVLHDGVVVAERYAPGFTPDTPLLGYSMAKSVVHALAGILVREGRLDPLAPAPVAAWRAPADPRGSITFEHLLRMQSGLDFDETDSGFDPVSTMLFRRGDMAAYAASARLRAAPGSTWNYTSGNTLIACGALRDLVGGGAAGMLRFAHEQLFAPLGMHHVLLEFDAAQTLIGSTRIHASARDWARLGQLYLDDGVVDGRRILPAGWAASARAPTLDGPYGAGFWTNAASKAHPHGAIAALPEGVYMASGSQGQRIVIWPSKRLVVVRLGTTIDPPAYDIAGLGQLLSEVSAALPHGGTHPAEQDAAAWRQGPPPPSLPAGTSASCGEPASRSHPRKAGP